MKQSAAEHSDLVETLLNQSFKGQEGMRAEAAKEIVSLKTALRRISSLEEKNVSKYAQEIARAALQPKEPSEDEIDASGAPHSGIPRFSPVSETEELVAKLDAHLNHYLESRYGIGKQEFLDEIWENKALVMTVLRTADHATTPAEQSLSALVKQYALDLRRNASGGGDYPYEYAKATADYLGELIKRAKGNCTCARAGFPDSCDNCDGISAPSVTSPDPKPFYGAQCPSYPNCTGGCGLGCTHEIEQAAGSSTTRECQFPKCGCLGSPLDPVCAQSSPGRGSK